MGICQHIAAVEAQRRHDARRHVVTARKIALGEVGGAELLDGDDALALEPDVQQHLVLAYLDHGPGQDLPLLDLRQQPVPRLSGQTESNA